MRFVVTEAHRGPVHAPLSLKKGDLVSVGETYKGPENWPGWVWCVSAGNIGRGSRSKLTPKPFVDIYQIGIGHGLS